MSELERFQESRDATIDMRSEGDETETDDRTVLATPTSFPAATPHRPCTYKTY
ncbi:MAG TPA: hypothetical protein VGN10_15575 [Pyrinomonadaceae bacterium]